MKPDASQIRLSACTPELIPEISRYFNHFRRLDFGSVYLLILALYEDHVEGQFGVDEFIAALRVLHSFILRRMIVGVPSNSLSGLFISLCRTKPVTDNPSAWLASSLGREFAEGPEQAVFQLGRGSVVSAPVYTLVSRVGCRTRANG